VWASGISHCAAKPATVFAPARQLAPAIAALHKTVTHDTIPIEFPNRKTRPMAQTLYDFDAVNIQGKPVKLSQFKGRALLIVNTASACGFTPQFAGLEALHKAHGESGLVVLGFPCNQFGAQDPGNNGEIAEFCQLNYGVSFPMMAKVDVNGADAHPLWAWLSAEAPGLLGSKAIKWNFTKFLVGKDGQVIKRYAPQDAPESLTKDIAAALAA
jgi:glutathione peroxidase